MWNHPPGAGPISFLRLATLCLLALLFGSCDLFSSSEAPSRDGYFLYIGNWDYDEIFVVDTQTNKIVRTLTGFNHVWALAATKSGRKLYVQTRDSSGYDTPRTLHVVDTRTWESHVVLHGRAKPYVALQGDVFVITQWWDSRQQALGRIDTLTDQVTFIDTLDLIYRVGTNGQYDDGVAFDPQLPLLYATRSSDRKLFAYDYDRREVVRVYESLYDPVRIEVSHDGKRLYVAGGPVLDLERDSVLAWMGGNLLGSLALHPSKDLLYITDPGRYLNIDVIPSGKVFIFDTQRNQYTGEIYVGVQPGDHPPTDDIALSPDCRRAYVSDKGPSVVAIDLETRNVIGRIIPRTRAISTIPLAIAPKP
ncbi:MAG TPA: hypothetical protein VFG50_06685 [Rhodothermales bacterium]|nr:hypothetical protein [Rhodothermales bacterium]